MLIDPILVLKERKTTGFVQMTIQKESGYHVTCTAGKQIRKRRLKSSWKMIPLNSINQAEKKQLEASRPTWLLGSFVHLKNSIFGCPIFFCRVWAKTETQEANSLFSCCCCWWWSSSFLPFFTLLSYSSATKIAISAISLSLSLSLLTCFEIVGTWLIIWLT